MAIIEASDSHFVNCIRAVLGLGPLPFTPWEEGEKLSPAELRRELLGNRPKGHLQSDYSGHTGHYYERLFERRRKLEGLYRR